MYASCEKVFDASIRRRPVIVLTNNDGCICAACDIAKKMGIGKKFVPYFKVRDELKRANAVIRSSNYELYADLSQKMMDICSRFAPHCHIYSIDECFLYFSTNKNSVAMPSWTALAQKIKKTVWKEVRLPVSVGGGSTPTLAKAACHVAKQSPRFNGVLVIEDEIKREKILGKMKVTDVWGIGNRIGNKLNDMGIFSALELSVIRPSWIRKRFSILVESTVYELNGVVKLTWDDVRSPKKEIYSTRSFGQRITSPIDLGQALATHAEIAATKLRRQSSLTKAIVIFGSNSPHDEIYYRKSVFHKFIAPTSDSSMILNACSEAVASIYKKNVRFYRCGIGLLEISDKLQQQQDLFAIPKDNHALMQCMDSINQRYGRNTVHLAAQGIKKKFAMRRAFLSPQYTTRWSDIPKIKC